jgi:hypothetical protein
MSLAYVEPIGSASFGSYDLLFCTSGSEQRSSFWHRTYKAEGRRKVVWTYSRDTDRRAQNNHSYYSRAGFTEVPEGTLSVRELVRGAVESVVSANLIRIALDISSMTREIMATWIAELSLQSVKHAIELDCFYSVAKYSPPVRTSGLAHSPVPVTPDFAGLWNDPESPLLLILGLGYEPYLATSFCEYLDPSEVVAFIPEGDDPRYLREITKQNHSLIEFLKHRGELFMSYRATEPFELYRNLESVVYGRVEKQRVNIAPYGPKIFALSSFLVAVRHSPRVMIWHINPNHPLPRTPNRVAEGSVMGLKVLFEPGKQEHLKGRQGG